jgi:hypothetical protein
MLVIGKEQMEAMEQRMMNRFVDKTLDFIRINFPEWGSGQSDDVLSEFVVTMTKFAQEHDMRAEISIQKLIAYQIIFGLSLPLPSKLVFVLKRAGLDEDSRLEYFVRQLEDMSPLIKLTLEDPAERLP